MTGEGNRKERRAAKARGELNVDAFVALADKFIDVANRENRRQKATDIHLAFLYGAARYNAFVAKKVLEVDDQEKFVDELAGQYKEMLRNHLADPTL